MYRKNLEKKITELLSPKKWGNLEKLGRLVCQILNYQRRPASNRRCISTPWKAPQILISKMESYTRCWLHHCMPRKLRRSPMQCFHLNRETWSGVLCSETLIRRIWEDLFLKGKKDHSLNQTRSDLAKQELHVESLNEWIGELQQTEAQRLALQDAQFGFVESGRKQVRLQEALSMKEIVLWNTQIRNMHEIGEIKRAQELRVDEVSVQKLSEITRQFNSSLHNCSKCRNRSILWMILEIFKMWNQIIVEGCLTFPVNLQWFRVFFSMLSRDKRLPLDTWNQSGLQEKVFGNQFSTIDSPRDHPQRIHSDDVQRNREAALEAGRTKTIHTSEDRPNQGTIPMPTFATRPLTTSSTMLADFPQNSMVGQQRQQISELQFDKFLNPPSFLAWKIRFKNRVTTCSDFPSDDML